MNCFANTLIDGVLLICYTELKDEAEKQLIHDRSKSPYRNFVRTDLTEEGQVLYIMAVDETARLRDLSGLSETVIIATDNAPEDRYGTVNGSSQEGAADPALASLTAPDVIVDQYDGESAVKTLEKLYEPYFWKK